MSTRAVQGRSKTWMSGLGSHLHISALLLPYSVWQAVGFPAADHHAPRWRQERRRKEGQRLRKYRACMYALCVCWYVFCVLHFCVRGRNTYAMFVQCRNMFCMHAQTSGSICMQAGRQACKLVYRYNVRRLDGQNDK